MQVFGIHFATLDIRQDSSIHSKVIHDIAVTEKILPVDFDQLPDEKKVDLLAGIHTMANPDLYDPLHADTLKTIAAVREIQLKNGSVGCNRYIISHCSSALNVLEVYGLFLLCGWKKEEMDMDIVPLFETVDDLQQAATVMKDLYGDPAYKKHLQRRQNKQTIMLGFSDGTKDGGYLMANWGIYKAKEELTQISREYGIDVVFFDGRGGPPARGGGKTHKFYASMGKNIANKQIQLTIQGQTVSSNFGTIDTAQFNIEQLLHAGISNDLFSSKEVTLQAR